MKTICLPILKLFLVPLAIWFMPDNAAAQAPLTSQTGTRLNLDVSVKAKVANDEMLVTFAVEKDGSDLAKVNEQVLQALNAALDDIKKVPNIRGRLESIYTSPSYLQNGKQSGWRVRGELSMRSQDLPAMATLTGQLSQKLQLNGIQFMLSDTARRATEKKLLNEAAQSFKGKAVDATAAFGFSKHRLLELNLGNNTNMVIRPMAANVRGKLEMSAASSAPIEGGDSEVVLTVSGSIEMQ